MCFRFVVIQYGIVFESKQMIIVTLSTEYMRQRQTKRLNRVDFPFKVAAVNEIGKGPYSSEVTGGLQQHMPTPSLIVVAGEALMKLDADLQEEREILSENSRVQWVSALLSNSSFAWMDMNSDVYITHMTTNYTERVSSIKFGFHPLVIVPFVSWDIHLCLHFTLFT